MLQLTVFVLLLSLYHPVQSKPNFVVLFVDDLGYGDLSVTGHPTIRTSNIQKMAEQGMTLHNWYSAYSVCSPSRAALLTGRMPIRSGINEVLPCNAIGGLPENETTIAELLKTQGYSTAILGKWHLGQRPEYLPTRHGFDYYFGVPFSVDMGCTRGCSNPDYPNCVPETCPNPSSGCTPLPLMQNETVIHQPLNLTLLSSMYAEEATKWITAHKAENFFLYMAFSHVHVADHVQSSYQWCGQQFSNASLRGAYGDTVMEMDWVVGQILNTLRQLQLDQNTVVFFTSDNGPWLCEEKYGGSAGLFREGKFSTWKVVLEYLVLSCGQELYSLILSLKR